MQVQKPLGMGVFGIITIIGIIALVTELTEFEEIAKLIVIPSLILLISVSAFSLIQANRVNYF